MLLFGFVAQLLAATVSLGNILNPKLLSDPFIGISALERKLFRKIVLRS